MNVLTEKERVMNAQARRGILRALAGGLLAVGMLLTVVWGSTTQGHFWPIQVLLPLAAILAVTGWSVLLDDQPWITERLGGSRTFALHLGISVSVWLYLVALWVDGGGGYFWPGWALLGLGGFVFIHAVEAFGRQVVGEKTEPGRRSP